MPRSGDLIVAVVAEVRNNLWFMNINGPFQGLLPMSLAPWKVEFGAARQHMGIGDVVLARVQEVDECHNVVLTMKGVGLRRLNQEPLSTSQSITSTACEAKATQPFNAYGMLLTAESSSEKTDVFGSMAMLKAPHGPAKRWLLHRPLATKQHSKQNCLLLNKMLQKKVMLDGWIW